MFPNLHLILDSLEFLDTSTYLLSIEVMKNASEVSVVPFIKILYLIIWMSADLQKLHF